MINPIGRKIDGSQNSGFVSGTVAEKGTLVLARIKFSAVSPLDLIHPSELWVRWWYDHREGRREGRPNGDPGF